MVTNSSIQQIIEELSYYADGCTLIEPSKYLTSHNECKKDLKKYSIEKQNTSFTGNSSRELTEESTFAYENLKNNALTCTSCPLAQTRINVVFGVGKITNPLVAIVGEAPDIDDDKIGEPFVGQAGELLTAALIKGMGLSREEVYLCNILKCRPPEERPPLIDEIKACIHYLHEQLTLVKPQIIITLGQAAQKALCNTDQDISVLRGQWQSWQGIRVMPTYHPAYILNNPSAKRPFWDDLQEVMKELGLK